MELSALQQEFLDDHRVLISSLKEIIESLERGDRAAAVRRAAELDADAGAHIAFEEEIFYPRLAKIYGDDMVERMISEHQAGHRAIKTLLSEGNNEDFDSERIMPDLEVALDHVLGCGTMLSELDSGQESADSKALERLRELRSTAEAWSNRSYSEN